MKKFILVAFACLMTFATYAQSATMPTIIVFPDDSWMSDNGFMDTFDNDGETEYLPNYGDAFVKNREITTAIQVVQKILVERGFQHEDLQNLLKDMKRERAEEMANSMDGDGFEKGAMDELLQQARPDIRVDIDFSVTPFGPRKNISFRMKAVDAYCNDQISSCEGIVEGTMDPLDLAFRKIVVGKMDEFCEQMVAYFQDLRDNGRQITVVFRAADGAGIDLLRDEIGDDDDTYSDFLYDWIRRNAVNRAAKKGRQTKKMCEFKNVRIPFFDDDNMPIEADTWAKGIRKKFKAETGIKIGKGQGNALGRANFLIGVE